ncbi:MAG: hypothetical protein JWO47_194 [Candidatus Saccharibacteria bacterium]|nr:hypothetical protein [Candidatus Saccharibacteria bacterium]
MGEISRTARFGMPLAALGIALGAVGCATGPNNGGGKQELATAMSIDGTDSSMLDDAVTDVTTEARTETTVLATDPTDVSVAPTDSVDTTDNQDVADSLVPVVTSTTAAPTTAAPTTTASTVAASIDSVPVTPDTLSPEDQAALDEAITIATYDPNACVDLVKFIAPDQVISLPNGGDFVKFTVGALNNSDRVSSDDLSTPIESVDPVAGLVEVQEAICADPELGMQLAKAFADMQVGGHNVVDLNAWLAPYVMDASQINDKAKEFIPGLDVKKADLTDEIRQAAIAKNAEYEDLASRMITLLDKFKSAGIGPMIGTLNFHLVAGGLEVGQLPEVEQAPDADIKPALRLILDEKNGRCLVMIGFNTEDKRFEEGTECVPAIVPTTPNSSTPPANSTATTNGTPTPTTHPNSTPSTSSTLDIPTTSTGTTTPVETTTATTQPIKLPNGPNGTTPSDTVETPVTQGTNVPTSQQAPTTAPATTPAVTSPNTQPGTTISGTSPATVPTGGF